MNQLDQILHITKMVNGIQEEVIAEYYPQLIRLMECSSPNAVKNCLGAMMARYSTRLNQEMRKFEKEILKQEAA